MKMNTKDKGRKWMWGFLGALAALQIYAVQEMLAALALFALGFLLVAASCGALYLLFRAWAVAVVRMAESQHPAMVAVRQGIDSAGELARRPFRRPRSAQPAS